jgi:hypothetical protein
MHTTVSLRVNFFPIPEPPHTSCLGLKMLGGGGGHLRVSFPIFLLLLDLLGRGAKGCSMGI